MKHWESYRRDTNQATNVGGEEMKVLFFFLIFIFFWNKGIIKGSLHFSLSL